MYLYGVINKDIHKILPAQALWFKIPTDCNYKNKKWHSLNDKFWTWDWNDNNVKVKPESVTIYDCEKKTEIFSAYAMRHTAANNTMIFSASWLYARWRKKDCQKHYF